MSSIKYANTVKNTKEATEFSMPFKYMKPNTNTYPMVVIYVDSNRSYPNPKAKNTFDEI